MKKPFIVLLLAATLLAAAPKQPKLVVGIIVDQLRYDYLTRFRSDYTSGLDRFLTKGAVFTNAHLNHFPTVTAVGHSTFLSGAPPSVSGIIANEWYDREAKRRVTSVVDNTVKQLGAREGQDGASPRRMLADTIGDELKLVYGQKSRVIGISLKDRGAILPAGHQADGAYWFDSATGNFVSSTYYFAEPPAWVTAFNKEHPGDRYAGRTWLTHNLPAETKALYGTGTPLETSPFGNEVVELFAERALEAEQLGRHEGTDLLTVSFSSNDHVGHEYGPYSPEVRLISMETDKVLGRLFAALEKQVGMDNVLVVLSADHGASSANRNPAISHMLGGRFSTTTARAAVQAALAKKFGEGAYISYFSESGVYLNYDLAAQKNLEIDDIARVAARAMADLAHVSRVYTREQILRGNIPQDSIGIRVMNGTHMKRSPDVLYIMDPFWYSGAAAGNHGTPYSYDSHVPLLFLGAGIRPGYYHANVAMNDVAPTLATLLQIETPAGSIGRVLQEMILPDQVPAKASPPAAPSRPRPPAKR